MRKDYLRLFLHGFNLIKTNRGILLCQSWGGFSKYKIIYLMSTDVYYQFLTKFKNALRVFKIDSVTLYNLFGLQYEDIAEKHILNMIIGEKLEIDINFIVYH